MNLAGQYVLPQKWIAARFELFTFMSTFGYTMRSWKGFARRFEIEESAVKMILDGRFGSLETYRQLTDHIREQTEGKVFGNRFS